MSNNKQSSVEWFSKKSWKLRVELEDEKISLGEYANKYYQLKQQAKAMEKQQIMDAHIHGHNATSSTIKKYDAEQYYKQEFGDET